MKRLDDVVDDPAEVARDEPEVVPSTVPRSVAAGAIRRMLREPASTREKTSRPFVSVPKGCAQLGGCARRELVVEDRVVRRDEPGEQRAEDPEADHDAPKTTVGERSSSRSRSERAIRASLRTGRGRRRRRRAALTPCSEADPWVEDCVEDVRDQRDDEVDDADHEDAGGEQREVLLLRRLVDQPADALVVEEHLDGDEAADEVADLDGDDGDRRQQRVPQHVPAHDDARAGGP